MNFGFTVYILTVLFHVSNTSYYVAVENGTLLQTSHGHGKWSLEVTEKSLKIFMEKKCGNPGPVIGKLDTCEVQWI